MQNENRIHLVPRPGPRLASAREQFEEPQATPPKRKSTLDPRDLVRETLAIARECREVLAGPRSAKNQLLVDLVASLAVARLQKRGRR